MAKIKILVLKKDNIMRNMLTTIIDFNENDKFKKMIPIKEFDIGNSQKLIIFEGNIEKDKVDTFKNDILKTKKLNIYDNKYIEYDVIENCRVSFLNEVADYPNESKTLKSPFPSNAVVYENWNNDITLCEIWINIDEKIQKDISKLIPVDLYYMIDRVGNIIYFKEIDEIDISVIHQNDAFITLGVEIFGGFIKSKYTGIIEVKSFDDVIIKKSFLINERFIDFILQDEDYNIKIDIYNTLSGECVFSRNFRFIKEIHLNTKIINDSILEIVNDNGTVLKKISLKTTGTKSLIKNKHSYITDLQKNRQGYVHKIIERENLKFIRFNKKNEAMTHLCNLITKMANNAQNGEYIYLADPYFLQTAGIIKLIDYMDIFNAAASIQFRIICTHDIIENDLKNFIKRNKNHIFNNVTIKSIYQKRKGTSGYIYIIDNNGSIKMDSSGNPIIAVRDSFHDRWISCKNEEYGFTNSINNFKKGVSFFKSLKHYFLEAEALWNIPSTDSDFIIQKYKLW
ncbi:MAG: hypothetical protein AB7E39_01145 [Endomicrobiaceae bacterium]